MRSISIFSTLLLFSFMSVFAQTDASLSKGIKLMEELQYESAKQLFNQLPESAEREYQLGKVALYEAQKEVAEQHFSKVSQLDSKSIFATIGQVSNELQKKNTINVSNFASRAIKQAKKSPELLAEVALICVIGPEKDFNQAMQAIERGKEVSTKSAALYLALGDVELARNEYGNALNAYEWAAQYDPNNALVFRKIGMIQTLARDYRNGVVSLNKSIELDPNQILVYKNLSDLQFLFGKYVESLKNYELYLSRTAQNIDDKERYALILFFNKKYDESAKEMDLVLAENPNSPVLYRIRGYSAFETGDYPKGVEAMKKFFELQNPNKIIQSDYSYYGKLNSKVKNDTLAIKYLKKAIQADSTKTEIFDELATVYSRNHMHLEAVGCYNQMLANGYPKGNGLFAIGKEYFFLGSFLKAKADSANKSSNPTPLTPEIISAFKNADSTFTELTVASPNYAGGYLWKGRALSFLDPESSTGLAKPAYEQAATIMEKDPAKNKKGLIESYQYLASFNYLSYDKNYKASPDSAKVNRDNAVGFFEKILQLDPNDTKTKSILQQLKK